MTDFQSTFSISNFCTTSSTSSAFTMARQIAEHLNPPGFRPYPNTNGHMIERRKGIHTRIGGIGIRISISISSSRRATSGGALLSATVTISEISKSLWILSDLSKMLYSKPNLRLCFRQQLVLSFWILEFGFATSYPSMLCGRKMDKRTRCCRIWWRRVRQ